MKQDNCIIVYWWLQNISSFQFIERTNTIYFSGNAV